MNASKRSSKNDIASDGLYLQNACRCVVFSHGYFSGLATPPSQAIVTRCLGALLLPARAQQEPTQLVAQRTHEELISQPYQHPSHKQPQTSSTRAMTTRGERSEMELVRSSGDHASEAALHSSAANAKLTPRPATVSKPRQREDESYCLYTSDSSPPKPPQTAFREDMTPVFRVTSDQYDDADDGDDEDAPPLLTLRLPTPKPIPQAQGRGDAKATTEIECLGLQMELRACLDANDNRESVCMWHFQMWQRCKKQQQQPVRR